MSKRKPNLTIDPHLPVTINPHLTPPSSSFKKPFKILTNMQKDIECNGTLEEEQNYIKTKTLFETKIDNVKNKCIKYNESDIIGETQNSTIYNDQDPNFIIKKSYIYSNAQNFVNNLHKIKINCNQGTKIMDIAMTENYKNESYSNLLYDFPEHFLMIQKLDNGECIDEESLTRKKISNILRMEKVRGIVFNDYITEIKQKYMKNIDIKEYDTILCDLLLQLTYVLLYANKNGYYHNDLKLNNIIIYSSDPKKYVYNKIPKIKMTLTSNYKFKLIDYSNSLKIPISKNIYVVDLNQIIIFYSNFLDSVNHTLELTSKLVNIINKFLIELVTKNNSMIVHDSNSLRLMDTKLIKQYGIKMNMKDIINLFREINAGDFTKIDITDASDGYLKYKMKYLELKKN